MSIRLLFLLVAAAAFAGWLAYLGSAVFGRAGVVVVSRGQLTAATHLIVADVKAGPDGLPESATVTQLLRGDGPAVGEPLAVADLPSAAVPGVGFPGDGQYLLAVEKAGGGYKLAGLPRSPGYEPATGERPPIYLWNAGTQAQLRRYGLLP